MSRTNLQSGVERKEKRHCHYPLHLFGLVFVSFQDGYSFFFFYSRDPREITTAIFTWFELSAAISRGYFFFLENRVQSREINHSPGGGKFIRRVFGQDALRVAPISQIHISTAVRASFSIPYCCVFIKWNFVPLYITCANQVVPIDYGGILGISF